MSLGSLSRLYSRIRLRFVALMLAGLLAACSPLDVAGALLGGGPNINGQIGAENNQGVNTTFEAPKVTVRPKARVDNIDQSTNTEVDPLLLALLIIGWLAPSPGEIGRSIMKLFRRK